MSNNVQWKRKTTTKQKCRIGFGCLLTLFVAMAAMAMSSVFFVTMSKWETFDQQQQVDNKNKFKEQPHIRLAPPVRKTDKLRNTKSKPRPIKNNKENIKPPPKGAVKEPLDAHVDQNTTRKENPPDQAAKEQDKHSQIHVVFSTSCHVKQDWQSYLFFYQAMIRKQSGTVTRIVSGCKPDEQAKLLQEFNDKIVIMSPHFKIHFTPEYGRLIPRFDWQKTKYWNKPFGLKHWLEHAFGYNYTADKLSTRFDDDVIVLVDPDMLIQRPFVNHFPSYMPNLWIGPVRSNNNSIRDRVSHGKPMAQDYSFGYKWLRSSQKNLTHVVGPDSPVHKLTNHQAATLYSAGPPYIVTARDMYQISYYWTKFLPRIFDLSPQMMSEMYGYCMAAAHLQLEHQLAQGFMVSDSKVYAEGWGFMDNVTDTACNVQQFGNKLPQVIHFCQRYSIGEYFWSKYKLPVEIMSCDFPLLELPPLDYAAYTNYSHYGDGSITVWEGRKKRALYQNAFMVCTLFPAINQAATYFKDHHCPHGANYNRTWNTFQAETEEREATIADLKRRAANAKQKRL